MAASRNVSSKKFAMEGQHNPQGNDNDDRRDRF
jgi:hypothetical protein